MLEMKEAKILFDSGGLKDARIMNEPISKGWIILFAKKEGKSWINDNYTSRRSESHKAFKDLRSAVNTVKKIGFNEVQIYDLQK